MADITSLPPNHSAQLPCAEFAAFGSSLCSDLVLRGVDLKDLRSHLIRKSGPDWNLVGMREFDRRVKTRDSKLIRHRELKSAKARKVQRLRIKTADE